MFDSFICIYFQTLYNNTHTRSMKYYKGAGLVNDAINKLPFELHFPGGYNYLGI